MGMRLRHFLTPGVAVFWAVVAALAVGTAVTGSWLQERIYAVELERAERETLRANMVLEAHAEQVLDEVDAALRAVRFHYVTTRSPHSTALLVDNLALRSALLTELSVADQAGRLVVTHNQASQNLNVSDRDFFQWHRLNPSDTVHVGMVRKGYVSGKIGFRVTRRIENPDGSFGGVVVAKLKPKLFEEFYRLHLPDGLDTSAQMFGAEDHLVRTTFPEPVNEDGRGQVDARVLALLEQQNEGRFVLNREGSDGAQGRYLTFRTVTGWPLTVTTAFAESAVRHEVAQRMWPFQLVTGLAGAVIVVLGGLWTFCNRQRVALRELAATDALTGVANRRYLMTMGQVEVDRAHRYVKPLTVLMLDIDKFKRVNDNYGHATGDKVLIELARLTNATVRKPDLVGRLGGEEFVVILPETPLDGGQLIAERLRQAVEVCQGVSTLNDEPVRFTISIGVAALQPNETTFDTVLGRADRGLYQAKESGRNRVCSVQ